MAPTNPRSIFVDLPAVRLAALDYRAGAPADAPVMLVLHGQTDSAWSMHALASHFASRFQVVSLDLRGHGDSDHPGGYTMLEFIGDVKGAIEHLSLDRPIIVGHSLGGQIAGQLAGLYPDLVGALVLAEGIGPPVAGFDLGDHDHDEARSAIALVSSSNTQRAIADVSEAARRICSTHPGIQLELALLLAEKGTRPTPEGQRVWKFDARTRHWIAGFSQKVAEARWNMVRCPTLVITGDLAWERWWHRLANSPRRRDAKPSAAEIARRVACFPGARHVELVDAGHMLQYDQPEALIAAVDSFVSSLPTPRPSP